MTLPLAKLEAAEPLSTQPAIRIRDLYKKFGQLTAVDGVSVDIARGEFFMIVGPSAYIARGAALSVIIPSSALSSGPRRERVQCRVRELPEAFGGKPSSIVRRSKVVAP